MEQLNCSVSKLKQPTKISSNASPSSTIATALAVAAAMGANENTATNSNILSSTTTAAAVTAGLKRKADDTFPTKNTRTLSANNAKPTSAANRGPLSTATNSRVNTAGSAKPSPATSTKEDPRKNCCTNKLNIFKGKAHRNAIYGESTASARAASNISDPHTSEGTPIGTAGSGIAAVASATVGPPQLKKKKRPAWDTKGRLEDMEELTAALKEQLQTSSSDMKDLSSKLDSSKDQIEQLESFRQNLESKVAVKENENRTILQQMQHAEQDLETTKRRHDEESRSMDIQHSICMGQLKQKQAQLKQDTELAQEKLGSTNSRIENQIQGNNSLLTTISAQSANCLALESDNRALKLMSERADNTLEQREEAIRTLQHKIAESKALVGSLDQQLRDGEAIRRQLHNTYQELKGNIRVFCRVRPVTSSVSASQNETATASVAYPGAEGREIELANATETVTKSSAATTYPFTFDRVFEPSSTQEAVFSEISQLVQSALDGYNVCIFAYGQTGSGKTHTMEGPLNATAESMGMIPRSVQQIYESSKALKDKGWSYQIEGQYVEIYNETVNDLLGNNGLGGGKKHEIRHGKNGKTTITDITTVVLTSPEKVAILLKKAAQNRSVGSTQMNERSSRSHSVFTLRLTGKNSITDESHEGVLNLIDLAGSERLSQSGATGDRLKETQAINRSLSALGDVIAAIANPEPNTFVPYRNSKLTYLLQNSLGGNSKTLMFVNVSPLKSNFNETLCSLRFAAKVNSCTIGTATKRIVPK
ncbi:kinesin-like nuclear fusion protein [Linnemannia gamsii]|uniref:Kinesin-like protein n=1 Tax=Linnemannia gamsii TaxID=64522 RepID=A0ABQ7JQ71_9FUNG|nr:kinesin-like nuclear fusion protein [Linnemannia gamsii]